MCRPAVNSHKKMILIVATAVDEGRRDPSLTIKKIKNMLEALGGKAEAHMRSLLLPPIRPLGMGKLGA